MAAASASGCSCNLTPSLELPNAADAALKKKKKECDYGGSSRCGGAGSVPGLVQWVKGSSVAATVA